MSRRDVLAGMLGVLGAVSCSRDTTGSSSSTSLAPTDELALVALFDATGSALRPGAQQRLPFALGRSNGLLLRDPPREITISFTSADSGEQWSRSADQHGSTENALYYPVSFTPPSPGRYEVSASVDRGTATGAFMVGRDVTVPQVRDRFPAVTTPTRSNPMGMTKICSRNPQCPFHEDDLAQTLAEHEAVVLLIAAPGSCRSDLCWDPVTLLVENDGSIPARVIHVEVYLDADHEESLSVARRTVVVDQIGLEYEPVLFAIDNEGLVLHRLDSLFDAREVRAIGASLTQ